VSTELLRLAALAPCVLLAAGFSAAADEAVVMMYHRFGEVGHPSTSVSVERFEGHLAYLADNGYTVVPLSEVVAAIEGRGELPERAVAITVEDAYLSAATKAHPRLAARGYPYTVFVATDFVDARHPGYMSWSQMREMEQQGATFANRGASHLSFVHRPGVASEMDRMVRVRGEIERAQARLQDELHPLEGVLAYPNGEYDRSVADLVTELGYVAFGQHSGAVGRGSDRRALPRYSMAGTFAGIDDFALKVATRPLPIVAVKPWDPVTSSRRPRVEVTLGATDARLERLRCFVGGQGEVELEWLDPGRRFAVVPPSELTEGRARVNCTAPAARGYRFHWFSHPWLVSSELLP
jgi:peptidoglycan/xylan/chitin deacetylase (PgdA/CDA1 family)